MGGGTPAYTASKAALNALTRMLAAATGRPGGRPVAPGAAGVRHAAMLPDGGPTGGFFRDGRPLPW
ncbi:hypothetical protein [Streptomyces lunalinharesii]|uniref:Short-chain dehydrogenase n=1 Tax=Streptomyces lunalinharesii TaxID=333384 RepID=A0ABN3T782_9ACTN